MVVFCLFVCLFEDRVSMAVLELVLVDQADQELTNICLHLPPELWDKRRVPSPPGRKCVLL